MQMLAFTQHPYMLLSSKALPLWLALLSPRDSAAKQESQPPNPSHLLLPLECVSALLDLAGMQSQEDQYKSYIEPKLICIPKRLLFHTYARRREERNALDA